MTDPLTAIRDVIRRQLPPDSEMSEHEAYMEIIEIMDKVAGSETMPLSEIGPEAF